MYNYSKLFTTLHDEKKPVGNLGRGTHYSVLREATWFNSSRSPLKKPKAHDFAIIWDNGHDEKVIDVVEHMYMRNLLAPVLFVGERKGVLSVIVSPQFNEISAGIDFKEYVSAVGELAQNQYEPWTSDVSVFVAAESDPQVIDSSQNQVELDLKYIHMLWDLGLKNFSVILKKPDLHAEPLLVDTIL